MRMHARRTPALLAVLALVAGLSWVVLDGPAASAAPQTFQVTSTEMCGGAGTFMQALADANANPGPDTIAFDAGLQVEAWTCNSLVASIHGYPLMATGPIDIVGNGATVVGGQAFISVSGQVNDPNSCPSLTGARAASFSVGLLEVGDFDVDNTGVAVSVTDLDFSGMPSLFLVEKNASLSITGSKIDKTLSFNDSCDRPPIQARDADVTLTDVVITGSSAPTPGVSDATSTTAVVVGSGSGDLVMDHVVMSYNFAGRAVLWQGSSAKIVSSQFYESGGLWLDGTSSQVVNTAWRTSRTNAVDRIVTTRGTFRTDASTFFWTEPVCGHCDPAAPSLGFVTGGTGAFDLHTTAIGAGADLPIFEPLLWGTTGAFTSDALTWVQPVGSQDAAAVNVILPNALTAAPGLNASFVTSVSLGDINDVTPLIGTLVTPGVLIDAVAASTCTGPVGANRLINPIDGSCITTDVFGKPRWDAGNGSRNIGAVQNVQTPHLAVSGIGDTTVDLQWNRPVEPVSGTITGYSVFYRPAAGGGYAQVDVAGAGTLGYTVSGLTNGTPYVFQIVAVYGSPTGVGPLSNEVTATPFAPVGVPSVSASPGATDVRLFWTAPDDGGHGAPMQYFVLYRPVGAADWLLGPGYLSGRTTLLTELDCGVSYEFAVAALAADGTPAPDVGSTISGPAQACPEPTSTTTSTTTMTQDVSPAVEVVPEFTG